ncbi:Putative Zinc finger Sec23/Sec24-type protein [Rhizopus microsporus]|nr:Putative Zinc finger Sec23/Sec24-type protein [Rhizopus microsporus]
MSAFHGNFFIRSSDLLALPNVPRDQKYVVEVTMEDDLKTPTVCFQTALLHTACNGERRIRVVTTCLPVSSTMSELYASANQQAITAYLGVKAVERGLTSKLDDARDAVVNKLVDIFGVYKTHVLGSGQGYNTYGQDAVGQMATQFGNMSMGPAAAAVVPAVPLLGARPHIADIDNTGPQARLPPNCSTLNAVPATESLLKKSRLPLALVLTPYRSLKEGDDSVPVVRDSVIARCRRCRTYINPFATFVEGGQRWKCNMCFLLNDVPAAFDYDSITQQPADRWKRPELNYGCVEFVAPTEYMVLSLLIHLFIFTI